VKLPIHLSHILKLEKVMTFQLQLRLKEIWQVDKTEDLANRIHKNVRCPAAG
jgi:hypothetical protein